MFSTLQKRQIADPFNVTHTEPNPHNEKMAKEC